MSSDILTMPELPRTGLPALLSQLSLPGEIQFPDGSIIAVGTPKDEDTNTTSNDAAHQPIYRIIFNTPSSLSVPVTEYALGTAYITNEINVQGDLPSLLNARHHLKERVPLRQKLQFLYDYFRTATSMNSQAIISHYDRGDDLYHLFLDEEWRMYSQGHFSGPNDTIEDASRQKLEVMWTSLNLKPGMRLLDIGGGWGGVTQFCATRGVHVTSLTISPSQARYIQRLIETNNLSGQARVFLQDVMDHHPDNPYDAVVLFGVIEHLPNYRLFSKKVYELLKPGGRMYLDGSAAVTKYAVSAFTRKYIWQGTHTFMTVQDVMRELLYHGFDVLEVKNETKDYEWTIGEWAGRLDERKEDVVSGWGEETYRLFRLFLWGGTVAFRNGGLQAYRVVAERSGSRGPRPGRLRRALGLGN